MNDVCVHACYWESWVPLRTRPTTFSQAKDPMDAEDWLKGVEKKLVIAQCTDHEKDLFAAH
jgi:hypothetical protein